MKYGSIIITFILLCTFLSCKEEMILVSSIKEITIPGRSEENQFVQYKLQFEVTKDDQSIQIKDVSFPLLDVKKENLKFDVMDVSSNFIITDITKKGVYVLNIRPNDELQNQMITTKKDEIIISITRNNKAEQIKISSFVKKTKRIR